MPVQQVSLAPIDVESRQQNRSLHTHSIGVYAHSANRRWEMNKNVLDAKCDDRKVDDIAEQLIHGEVGSKLSVIFGGGRNAFRDISMLDEDGAPSKRSDGKNLIQEWLEQNGTTQKRSYVSNKVRRRMEIFIA